MPTPVATARLQLAFAAVLFSTGGAVIKSIPLESGAIACLRSAIAAATLLLLVPAGRRLADRKVWLVACAYAATLILFVFATKLTTSLNAIGLQSTAPLWLAVFAPLLLRERVRPRDVATMIVIALGMIAFVQSGEAAVRSAPDPARGNWLGAASGFAWAFTLIGLRWLSRGGADRATAAVVAGNLIGMVVCLRWMWPVPAMQAGAVVALVYLGVVQIALAYVCVTRGVTRVPALDASLLLLIEPVLNPIWVFIVHDERPSALAWLGAAAVFTATTAKSVFDAREARTAKSAW